MQSTFRRIFNQDIALVGASRTDAGVHALGQVATFRSSFSLAPEMLRQAWNQGLPSSIYIRSLDHINGSFHPCADVHEKTYLYTLFLQRPLPFVARFGWLYGFIHRVDLDKFDRALKFYLGEHDFASFCKYNPDKSSIRTINAISLNRYTRWGAVQVVITGPSFLHFQIRRMIGYALDVARRPELPVDYIQYLLKNPNPEQTLLKADASGLCLRKVVYKNDVSRLF